MLVKVSDGSGGWNMIDKVDHVHLLSSRHTVKSLAELNELTEQDVINLIAKDAFKAGRPLEVGKFEFVRNEKTRQALFTDVVYICNDDGNTLDKLSLRPLKGGK